MGCETPILTASPTSLSVISHALNSKASTVSEMSSMTALPSECCALCAVATFWPSNATSSRTSLERVSLRLLSMSGVMFCFRRRILTVGAGVGSCDTSIIGIWDLSIVSTTGWWSDACGMSDLTRVLTGNTACEIPECGESKNSQSSTRLQCVPTATFEWCVSYEYSRGWRVSQRSVGLNPCVLNHCRVRLSLVVSLCVGLSVVIHAALRSPPSSMGSP
mmetsp:Transcript_28473/g.47820  ORF Transcript_28473/g.47820 Transcript_28473/m.47820 type:complete len:219 (+) Transcript_28473:717-1373(+)